MGTPCIHCGEDCGSQPVLWNEKTFCCHGCSTVYQILNKSQLEKYYEIQPMAGIKLEKTINNQKFAFLDNEEIAEKLLTFSDGGICVVRLYIPTIHCASCIWLLENLHTLHSGVSQSLVNFPVKTVNITFNNREITLRQLVEMLASIHYVPEINLAKLDKKETHSNRTLLIKIGISGFSFMNVMLYKFPEYLPGGDQLGSLFTGFFGVMSFILALPVVFYSANDYYLSAFKGLKHKIINIDLPITLGIFTLFLQSTYEIVTVQGIGYMDSLIGLVFFLLIGKWYQGKTYQALSFERDYKSYFPVAVTLVSGSAEQSIPLSKLEKGHRILIRNQELIPADAILLSGVANIDYSFVTGESIPVPKKIGEMIYAGGRQSGSSIELEVIHQVEQSYLTQLWNQDKGFGKPDSSLGSIINKVSEYFTIIILAIGITAGIYWLFYNPSLALYAFTSVLIIACPCALALTVPFTFGSTMRVFGRAGFYIKNTEAIENLSKIDTIVFDKTGTITLNKSMDIRFVGDNLSGEDLLKIKFLASHSSHPLSTCIKESIAGDQRFEISDYQEIPSMGISGVVNETRINLGSKKFVTGKADDAPNTSNVYCFINHSVAGYFSIANSYRPGLESVIRELSKNHVLYLLSGDNDSEKNNLGPLFGNNEYLRFNQSPQDKMSFIEQLIGNGKKVLMVGDGLNDAGALMESSVGLTIADDIYSFSPACDGIIESKQFERLPSFFGFSKLAIRVVILSFIISFLYNLVGLYFAVQGLLSPIIAAILMPISSVTVVTFATFSIRLMAKRYKL
ncbi:MAG: heavy metal translocating P-type ATPase [Bacteroidetes bacterium HGW-Bacteroidetes-16]|jgi:Cu+-exporting ATPase|nr:MAG: heavy metal translocating P-type ATPase [Bacteroidetes bacterium HGW-Bacteroidetes-16]